ncbi:MAG: hypothetical protein ACPGGG_09150 [Parvibaculales bacterium]
MDSINWDSAKNWAAAKEGDELFEPVFDNVVTLDPTRVEEVWDRLSMDTQALELQSLTRLLLRTLAIAIEEEIGGNHKEDKRKENNGKEDSGKEKAKN